ncbi:MAG: hypothetical protein Q9212_002355 [Teloschistes hypoglaucus]
MASWQVDIPSLSNLVASAGAHGLKQLALSGVDIHTLGCMLMVSELIPSCQEFRLDLNTRREKQRGERRWLFNAVELGAGTSFLVDHLLKTRAGENVLSLMVSIVPLTTPEHSIVALSTLFDIAGVKPDHTPGVCQLHKLRSAITPFSRAVGFQEKVLQYHSLFERILGGKREPCKRDPDSAIPDKRDLSRIIQLCRKIATAEKPTVIVYRGFIGSGWVAAYASCILGFSVCALDGSGVQLPINDHYGQAKVILDLAAVPNTCEVHVEGHLSDVVRLHALEGALQIGWSINCLELNFLTHNLPKFHDRSSISLLSEVAAFHTLERLALRLTNCYSGQFVTGFRPYIFDSLPQIQARSLENLALLGFHKHTTDDFWLDENFKCQASFSDQDLAKAFAEQPGWPSGVERTYSISEHALVRIFKNRSLEHCNQLSDSSITELCHVLDTAVWLASTLAFTDWNTGLRTIAAQHFHVSSSLVETTNPWFSCFDIIKACTDIDDNSINGRLQYFEVDGLALNLDGVIILGTLAVSPAIHKTHGKIYSLLAGHITFDGQERKSVSVRMEPRRTFKMEPIKCGNSHGGQIGPENVIPNLHSRQLFSGLGETLYVRYEILKDVELFTIAHTASVPRIVLNSYIALPCQHSYYDVTDSNRQLRTDPRGFQYKISAGFRKCRIVEPDFSIFYQQVDNNELGQWLAYQDAIEAKPICILQRETCLNCIVDRICQSPELNDQNREKHGGLFTKKGYGPRVLIIAGRLDQLAKPSTCSDSSRESNVTFSHGNPRDALADSGNQDTIL